MMGGAAAALTGPHLRRRLAPHPIDHGHGPPSRPGMGQHRLPHLAGVHLCRDPRTGAISVGPRDRDRAHRVVLGISHCLGGPRVRSDDANLRPTCCALAARVAGLAGLARRTRRGRDPRSRQTSRSVSTSCRSPWSACWARRYGMPGCSSPRLPTKFRPWLLRPRAQSPLGDAGPASSGATAQRPLRLSGRSGSSGCS